MMSCRRAADLCRNAMHSSGTSTVRSRTLVEHSEHSIMGVSISTINAMTLAVNADGDESMSVGLGGSERFVLGLMGTLLSLR